MRGLGLLTERAGFRVREPAREASRSLGRVVPDTPGSAIASKVRIARS